MIINVCSTVERLARVVTGLGLLSLLYFLEAPACFIGLLGFVLIASAVFKYCPVSQLLGINTCVTRERPAG